VSAKPEHKADMLKCAQSLQGTLEQIGMRASIEQTPGHPIVLAKNEHREGRPTVLFYGHYDVQPPEPHEHWTTHAFEPTVRDGKLYARGAVDDKGQVWTTIEALRAWHQHGGAPVNVTILLEGEEEVGSEHLADFMKARAADLKADIAVISDTGQFARGVPAITYGLRGLVYEEVFLSAAGHDLHSGIFGGAVPNPANVLCGLLGSLHDADGRVTVPGFYDDVVPLTDAERDMWRKLPFDEAEFLSEAGLAGTVGEKGFSNIERRWARPTLDINGLTSGYQGHGAKTIIPAKASAKVSMRLVPRQDPKRIREAFEEMLRAKCPKSVKIEFATHGGSPAVLVPIDGPAMKLAADAVAIGFGKRPTFIREGGSIPVVGLLKNVLGIDTLLVGFGLPDDRLHSPNEKFDLDCLYNGTRAAAALYGKLAQLHV
jgi:acetylornithine deacetylase/succinyl-diaminopimelate desuccinylase-like protein